jgi:hypothetical protein
MSDAAASAPTMPRGSGELIYWASASFDVERFRAGTELELEHGARDPAIDVAARTPSMRQDRRDNRGSLG